MCNSLSDFYLFYFVRICQKYIVMAEKFIDKKAGKYNKFLQK